jgi:hypothetical protein
VQLGTVYTPRNLPTGLASTIVRFTASATTVTAGQPVRIKWAADWNVSNPGYRVVSPAVGAIHGTSVVVNPLATIAYEEYATNEHVRSVAEVKVTVRWALCSSDPCFLTRVNPDR